MLFGNYFSDKWKPAGQSRTEFPGFTDNTEDKIDSSRLDAKAQSLPGMILSKIKDTLFNTTAQAILTEGEEGLKADGAEKDELDSESAQAVVHEYNIVKEMLINNSLPVSEGNADQANKSRSHSTKLIIDKKILLNLLIDLQRFRKTLNLTKSFYIFHLSYQGKPEKMEEAPREVQEWHKNVERRVT